MENIKIAKTSKKIKLIFKDNCFFVKGPLGLLELNVGRKNFSLIKGKKIFISHKKLKNFVKSIQSTFYSLVVGWFLELNLNGIGFKCFKIGNKIALDLGYSNIITFEPHKKIKIKLYKNKLVFFSYDKQYIMNVAHLLKKSYKIDRYKGKGILIGNKPIDLKKKLYH